jgi:phenylacetate-CoA ligase
MGEFFDELETSDCESRERRQFAALADQIAHARQASPAFASILADVEPADICDRAALARLPVVRKSELMERQAHGPDAHRPFGGLTAVETGRLAHIFVSPGPIYDPEGRRGDWWRLARALWAAGLRRGDIVHNCFSYHFTPGGLMFETGAHEICCAVVPAGVGNTEQQVRSIADIRPSAYVGTPSFLKIILDKGREMGADLSSLRRALVSGEALPAPLRAELSGHGIAVRQCYATADLGLIGYESVPDSGLILDEWVIVEILRPGTGDPVGPGEVGEVAVTTLHPDYPLIRFATGDLESELVVLGNLTLSNGPINQHRHERGQDVKRNRCPKNGNCQHQQSGQSEAKHINHVPCVHVELHLPTPAEQVFVHQV